MKRILSVLLCTFLCMTVMGCDARKSIRTADIPDVFDEHGYTFTAQEEKPKIHISKEGVSLDLEIYPSEGCDLTSLKWNEEKGTKMFCEGQSLIGLVYYDKEIGPSNLFYSNMFEDDTLKSINSEITKEAAERYDQMLAFEEMLEEMDLKEEDLLRYIIERYQ